MSNTDRPQVPRTPERGAWPDPSSRRRDLARSATDGWPSVSEWRAQRTRQRAAQETPAEGSPETPAGSLAEGAPSPILGAAAAEGRAGEASEAAVPGSDRPVTDAPVPDVEPRQTRPQAAAADRDAAEAPAPGSAQAGVQPLDHGDPERAEAGSAAERVEGSGNGAWWGSETSWTPPAVVTSPAVGLPPAAGFSPADGGTPPEPPRGAQHPFFAREDREGFVAAQDGDDTRSGVSPQRRPGDAWHSEVLPGPSWFAPAPEEGDSGRPGRSRLGGGRDSLGSGHGSSRGERGAGFGAATGPSDDGVEPFGAETRPSRDGAGVFGAGAGGSKGESETFSGGAGASHGEREAFGEGAGRRGRKGGRYGKKPRKGGAQGRGWLPDGPDDDSPAGAAPQADPESVARAICLRLLTMAPKTRAQLAEALRKRDVPEEAAEAVLSRFSELGLINDEAFAAAWVDSRHHGRGLAKRALAAELRHRGVDSETVSEAVERLAPDQEEETARRLVERKLAATRSLDPQKRTRRLAGMLARKGYPSGLAFRVIREALEQEGIEMDEDFS
ncbi:recombination regulator RecX [Nonomuraea sp. NPDC004580]|uniref:recombination regulator RecX n=1 Tax=Nonomuraea sp. NPDC004580 TaxID=3154552 RepID=UPI0033A3E873